jgi:hypothetical protein
MFDPDFAADTDLDGRPDGLEYFLGTDPSVADRNHQPEYVAIQADGQTYPAIRFNYLAAAIDTDFCVEVSSNLTEWLHNDEENATEPVTEVVERATVGVGPSRRVTIRSTRSIEEDPVQYLRIRYSIGQAE